MLAAIILCSTSIHAKIAALEAKLSSRGVEVRPLDSLLSAKADYADIAKTITAFHGKDREAAEILAKLTAATRKPVAQFIRTQRGDQPIDLQNDGVIVPIDEWCQNHASQWARKRDWVTLSRLFDFEAAFKEQLYRSGSDIFGRWLPDMGDPPLGYLAAVDTLTRHWLRRRLEAFDFNTVLLGTMSRFGRLERSATGTGRVGWHFMSQINLGAEPNPPPPIWAAESKSDPLFRQKADLAMLAALNKLVDQTLRLPIQEALSRDFGAALWKLLERDKSNPSAWAADHTDVYSWSNTFDLHGFRSTLVELDLRDSFESGKPMKPTWSKAYCGGLNGVRPIDLESLRKQIKKYPHAK